MPRRAPAATLLPNRRTPARTLFGALPLVLVTQIVPATRLGQTTDSARWVPRLLGAQFTLIAQDLAPFSAPYSGPNSLVRSGDTEASHTYGVYLGVRAVARLQLYVDVEMVVAVHNSKSGRAIRCGRANRLGVMQERARTVTTACSRQSSQRPK